MGTILDIFFKPRKASALITVLGLVSAAFWITPAQSAQLKYTGDFETGDLSKYRTKIYDNGKYGFVNVVTSPVRSGKYAASSIVDGGNPSKSDRAEVVTDPDGPDGKYKFSWDGPEYWAGFSIYFKEWNASANTFVQIHAPNEEAGSSCDFAGNTFSIQPGGSGSGGTEPQMHVKILDNPSGVSSGKGSNSNMKVVHSQKMPIGSWQDFVVRFKLSTKGDGYYEIWQNGKKIHSEFNMTNVNWKDSCGNPISQKQHNGLHFGIYSGKDTFYRRMFFDEVRIAEGTNGYDLVSPGGSATTVEASIAPPAPPTGLR